MRRKYPKQTEKWGEVNFKIMWHTRYYIDADSMDAITRVDIPAGATTAEFFFECAVGNGGVQIKAFIKGG